MLRANNMKKFICSILAVIILTLIGFAVPIRAEEILPSGSTGNVTYEAIFELNEYNITYDLKGGSLPAGQTNKTKYTIKTPCFTLVNPEREGFTFVGWSGGYEGDVEEVDGDHYVSDTDVQLSSVEDYTDGDPYKLTVTLNRGVTESTTDEELETMASNLISAGDRKYKAHWFRNSYGVTVEKGEGIDEVTGTGTYVFEQPVTLGYTLAPGYEFDKWTSDDVTVDSDNKFSLPAKNVTVTANGKIKVFNITYDYAGGVAENPTTYTVVSDEIVLNNPTRTGYTFIGWTGSNGDTPEMEVRIPTGSLEDRTYTANWDVNMYKIKYDKNHPDAAPEPVEGETADSVHTYDISKTLTPNGYALEGYKFINWNTEPDGNGTTYENEQEVLNLSAIDEDVLTLYAMWDIDTFTVSFEMNGHGVAPDSQSRDYYTQATRPADDPSEEKWTFVNWYKEKACLNEYDFSSPIKRDTVIYAKWTRAVTEATQGTGGEGIHLEVTAGGQKYDKVFSLKGGDGAGVTGECETDPLPEDKKYLKDAAGGGINTESGATNIERSEVKDANGKTIFKLIDTVEDESASNATSASIEWNKLLPAIRYDANGGQGSISDLILVDSTGAEVSKAVSGQSGMTKAGYKFMGWNTKWNGKGTAFAAGATITPDQVRSECQTQGTKILHLYAMWQKL